MRFSLAATELDRKKQQKEFNRKKQQKERARKTVPLAARNCNVAEPVEPEAVTACDAREPLGEEVLKTVDEPVAEEKAQEVRLVESGTPIIAPLACRIRRAAKILRNLLPKGR